MMNVTLLLLVACLSCCVGCQKPSPFVPVRGKVTYGGAPVEHVLVVFSSLGEAGRAAADYTDEMGRFELETYISPSLTENGALPCDYDVYFFKREPMRELVPQPGAPLASDLYQKGERDSTKIRNLVLAGLVDPGPGPPTLVDGKSLIPEQYSIKPMFTVVVEGDGEKTFDFDLHDEGTNEE